MKSLVFALCFFNRFIFAAEWQQDGSSVPPATCPPYTVQNPALSYNGHQQPGKTEIMATDSGGNTVCFGCDCRGVKFLDCSGDSECMCNPALALHVLSNAGGKLGTFVEFGLSKFGELVGLGSQNKPNKEKK
jgi:hypothetical protein